MKLYLAKPNAFSNSVFKFHYVQMEQLEFINEVKKYEFKFHYVQMEPLNSVLAQLYKV